MLKKLSEISLEELWELFSIFLTEHKSCWKDWFDEESERLKAILPKNQMNRINHIGKNLKQEQMFENACNCSDKLI